VLLSWGQKHGFDLGVDASVHTGHLEFVFEVRYGAQTTNDNFGALVVNEVHQQGIKADNFDIFDVAQHFTSEFNAFGKIEQRTL